MRTNKVLNHGAHEITSDADDPVLRMTAVGKELWAEGADRFVARLRSEEFGQTIGQPLPGKSPEELGQAVWSRIEARQGEEFRTVRGLPFTYRVEGNGIWFFRSGKRVEMRLARNQVNEAISRCPLQKTTEIKDLVDFAYLFALLMDPRIRGQAW